MLSPEAPFFGISTSGLAGVCHIELPHDGDLIDNFQCTALAITSYRSCHIKPAMKALSYANKVSLRTDECGLLCFQYMVKSEEGRTCYIEYYVRISFIALIRNFKLDVCIYIFAPTDFSSNKYGKWRILDCIRERSYCI